MLNPLMLLGLLGLSVPIIIHLIQRQRLRPQPLATLQFLDREDVANAFAPTPRDLLQLLLRLLLLALFVLLMSRLALQGATPGPRTHIVILDQSMSMGAKPSPTSPASRFELAKAQIGQLIDELRGEDTMAICLVGDRVTSESGFSRDAAELRAFLETASVSGSGGQAMLPAIREAVSQLRTRRDPNAAVIVFSDQQRASYEGFFDDAPEGMELREHLASGGVRLLFVDAPGRPANMSVVSASFSPPSSYLGAGARLTTVVRNDQEEAADVNLQLFEGSTGGANRMIQVLPGETVHVDLVHRFESPVDSALRVEIGEDALAGDNLFHLPMRMRSRQQILLISPAIDSDESENLVVGYSGIQLLTYALNPGEALGMGNDTYVSVRRISPAFVERVSLPMYSVIILYGVANLTDQTIRDLRQFMTNGGGLFILPDRDVSPLRFNEVYGPLLQGLQVGQAQEPDIPMGLSRAEAGVEHSLLLPLLHESWGSIDDLHLLRYLRVEATGQARPVLRAANGDWLAASIQAGSGRAYLQLFTTALEDSSFPRSTVFVPMIQEILAWLGQTDEQEPIETIRVGDLLRLPTPSFRGLTGNAVVTGPVTQTVPLTGNEGDEVLVEGLLHPGAYQLTHPASQTGRLRWFTVNPVAEEADLEPLAPAEFASLFGETNVEEVPFDTVSSHFTGRRELAGLLVLLVLLALMVESLVGAWQSRTGYRARKLAEVKE